MRSEHIQQIYRGTPMPKCDFSKVALPVNLVHIFRTPFPKNTSGRLLLWYVKRNWPSHNLYLQRKKSRSSHPEVFLGKGILKKCSKFTGEHPAEWCSPVNLLHISEHFFLKTSIEGCFSKLHQSETSLILSVIYSIILSFVRIFNRILNHFSPLLNFI